MPQQFANINIKPIIYEKDSDGNYVLNTNNEKIIIESCQTINGKKCDNIKPSEDFDYKINITEYGN